MKQDELPAAMSEHDQQLYEDMMCRLELTALWTELSSLLSQGVMLPRQRGGCWRAIALPPAQGEIFVSEGTAAALRNTNGTARDLRAFTHAQVRNTMAVTLNCLEASANEWGDTQDAPLQGHRGAH